MRWSESDMKLANLTSMGTSKACLSTRTLVAPASGAKAIGVFYVKTNGLKRKREREIYIQGTIAGEMKIERDT